MTSEFDARFENRKPKIFVGIVSFGDIPKEAFASWLMFWGHMCAKYTKDFDLLAEVSPRKEQYRARNYLVESARQNGADFMLMLDDDQMPHLCNDMLELFWELGQPIAGGLYFQRGGLYHPVVMKEYHGPDNDLRYRFLHVDELPDGPAPVDVVGHGCHFVDMDVFDKIKEPFHWPYPHEAVFVPDDTLGMDVDFCRKVRALGYEVWLHPYVHIGHLSIDRSSVDWRTRPPQQQIENSPLWQEYHAKLYDRGLHIVEDPRASAA